MNKKKRELLDQADWEQLILRLTMYALSKLRRRFFFKTSPLGGMDIAQVAQDQVMEAIVKLWTEEVCWDYETKDLLFLLKGVIDSQVSHLFDNDEYLTTGRFPIASSEGINKDVEVEELLKRANPYEEHARDLTPSAPPNPEEALLGKEQEKQDKTVTDILLERLKGNKELEDAFLCVMAGTTKPQAIAEEMGIEVRHVNNLQKKLRRAYIDLQGQARKEKL